MTKQAELKNLTEQKTMLANKYERLVKSVSSKVRRERYRRQAATYWRQVADLKRKATAVRS